MDSAAQRETDGCARARGASRRTSSRTTRGVHARRVSPRRFPLSVRIRSVTDCRGDCDFQLSTFRSTSTSTASERATRSTEEEEADRRADPTTRHPGFVLFTLMKEKKKRTYSVLSRTYLARYARKNNSISVGHMDQTTNRIVTRQTARGTARPTRRRGEGWMDGWMDGRDLCRVRPASVLFD